MPNKQRDYCGHFAMLDIDFVFNDARLYDLSDGQKWFFVCLWCLAIKERNPNLGQSWSAFRPKVISRYTHVNLKVVRKSLESLTRLGLIEISSSGDITVCGVKEKHPNIRWKDRPNLVSDQFDVIETETETDARAAEPQSGGMPDDQGVLDKNKIRELTDQAKLIFDFYIKHSGRDPNRYRLTAQRARKIKARLKEGFTFRQMTAAIQAVPNNPWNRGENPQGKRYIELDSHIFRSYEQTEQRLREFEDQWGKVDDCPGTGL